MTPEERIKTCCVIKCKNTPLNSKVSFFSFPACPDTYRRYRSFQRDKWVQVIKTKNGQWWLPNEHSLVCSEHFVHGRPSSRVQDEDFIPSVFVNSSGRADFETRGVTLKKFALEYIKHDALLEWPFKSNNKSDQRQWAYVKLAAALCIPVSTARSWEKRFRDYFKQKMAETPDWKKRTMADGAPHWLAVVAQRICQPPKNRGGLSPDGVVLALADAARARNALCSTALYNDVRRALRLGTSINDLHAIWVAAQRVSLQQVNVWARAGDAGDAGGAQDAAPAHAALPPQVCAIADLVLLHTDVDMHRLVTDESVTLYEEAAALHTLWQLVQRHQLEQAEPEPSRELAQRWTLAHQDYLDSGRCASLVVLQRRWHELKLQARVRLAAHWRRGAAPPAPPAPHAPPPQDLYPRPAPIHIQILKRYPHVATGAFRSWRQLVQDGAIITEPLVTVTKKKKKPRSQITTQRVEETQDENNDSAKKTHTMLEPKVDKFAGVEPTVERPDTEPVEEGPAVVEPRIEGTADCDTKPTVELHTEKATHNAALIKQSTDVDPLATQSTVNEQSHVHSPPPEKRVRKREIVHYTENNSLVKHEKIGDKKTDLLVMKSTDNEAETQDNDFSNKPSVDHETPAKIPLKSTNCPVASSSGAQGRPGVSNKHIHHNERTQAISSGTDSDDGNLVIDECSNKTPSPLKREPVARTDRHSVDIAGAPNTFGVIAPTIAVLQMIDPSTVKTEILFDSDEEDFQPCVEENRVESEVAIKKELSFIANKLVFADEEPAVSCDVKRDDDVTERIDSDVTQRMNGNVTQGIDSDGIERMDSDDTETDELVADTPTIDPKLLLDARVRLFKIDKIKAWKKNVRKDNSIKPSRIHWRFHTPNPAAYYRTKSGGFSKVNPKHKNNIPKSDKDTPKSDNDTPVGDADKPKSDIDKSGDNGTLENNRKSNNDTLISNHDKPKTNNDTPNSNDITKLQEIDIKVEESCLDKVANTESVRELSRAIKRELIDEQLETVEDITPYKRIKTESDEEDDQPLLMIKKNITTMSETEMEEQPGTADDSDTVLSSDDEWSPQQARREGRCGRVGRRRVVSRAADAIACRAAPARGGRVPKRVRLPDRDQLRAHTAGTPVAQVAPISSTTEGDKAPSAAEPPTDTADDETPLAWRALDLPAHDQLEAALDGLTSASAAAAVLESTQCCAARRHRDVNDARRRLGAAEVALHTHPDGPCTCCCAHLLHTRAQLAQQLGALYADIQRLLTKAAEGKSQSKPAPKKPCSPIPVFTKIRPKPAPKDMPSTITTEAKKSKTKAKPATYANRSKKGPANAQEEPPAPPVDYYLEWQRQKTLNDKYFHISSLCSGSKKDKTTTSQSTAPQSTVPLSTAPQSSDPNSMTLQGKTPESTTPQSTAPQTTSPKSTARKSTTLQNTVLKSTTSQSVVTLRNTPGGLMPYIRESRLVTTETRLVHTIQLPSLHVATHPAQHVPSPAGVPYRVGVSYPFARYNSPCTQPDSPLHTTPISSGLPPPWLHKTAISCGLPDPSLLKPDPSLHKPDPSLHNPDPLLLKPDPSLLKPDPSLHKPDPSLHNPDPLLLKPDPSLLKPDPSLHKPDPSLLKPEPSLHKPNSPLNKITVTSGLPISTLHKKAISSKLPISPLHKKAISSKLPISPLPKKAISSKLPISPLHKKAISSKLPISPLPKKAISSKLPISPLHKKAMSTGRPDPPLHNTGKRTLAPKPESMRLASMARHHIVPEKLVIQDTAISTTPAAVDPLPRRIDMTTEQMTAPLAPTSEPVTKSVSILEEYSRTLRSDPVSNLPMINGLSIRVPDGAQGQKTTVLLSLNLPSKEVADQTKQRLYANDEIDLTEETEASAVKAKNDAQRTPVVDIVGMVNSLFNVGNKNTGRPSTANLDKSTKRKHKPPAIMSLSNKLHDGDIIEVDDSDDDGKTNKRPVVINKSSNPIVYSNTSSNTAKCDNTETVNESVSDDSPNQAIASTSNTNKVSKQASRNINRRSIKTKSSNAKIFVQPTSGTDKVINQAAASTSSINETTTNTYKNIGAIEMSYNNKDTGAMEAMTSNQATGNTNKNVNIKEIINKKYAEAMHRVPTANQTALSNMSKITAIRQTKNTESASNMMPEGATDNSVAQRTQELENCDKRMPIDDQLSGEADVADQ